MKNKICLLSLIAFLLSGVAWAQQPQTTNPIYRTNAQWANGVAPGYWPTKGTGLTLNISAGTVFCQGTIRTYAGGTLTMTNSTTNYVYLDTTASCAPATRTSIFDSATIPIAVVVASGGVITTITDDRTTMSTSVGTGSIVGGSCTNQYVSAIGSTGVPTCVSFPDVKIIPAAECVGGTAASGWSYASGQFTPTCRAGTNNLGANLAAVPNTGAAAQFLFHLPGDWDTAQQPYINIVYTSGTEASGTVINTVSSACVDNSTPGASSDDPSFHAESAFSTQTMANTNRMWNITGQFTQMTSGNGCKVNSSVIIKIVLSGTASTAGGIGYYYAVMTTPLKPQIQAN